MTTAPVRSRRKGPWWIGPILWSGLSQTMSSVTNFGLVAALTVAIGTAELGRVSAVLSVYLLSLAAGRSLFTEPMVAAGRPDDEMWRCVVRRVTAVALGAMPVAGLIASIVGLRWTTAVLPVVAMAPLLIQDAWRYRAWAQGRPSRAVLLDAIWLVVSLVAGAAAVVVAGRGSPGAGFDGVGSPTIVGAWCLGGTVSAALGRAVVGRPERGAAASPAEAARAGDHPVSRAHRELAQSQTVAALSFNLTPVGLATVVSPTLAGAARAVLLPFTPILSLVAGLRLVTLPALVRWAEGPAEAPAEAPVDAPVGSGRRSPALAHAAFGAVVTAPVAATLALVVTRVPSAGDALELVEPHLPVGVALCVLFVAAQLLADGVALGPGREATMRLRLVVVAVEWTGLLAGAGLGGVAGLVRGWTVGLGLAVVVWAVALLHPGSWQDDRSDR